MAIKFLPKRKFDKYAIIIVALKIGIAFLLVVQFFCWYILIRYLLVYYGLVK